MDRRAWWTAVHEVAKSRAQLGTHSTELIFNVVLLSAVQQGASVIHMSTLLDSFPMEVITEY